MNRREMLIELMSDAGVLTFGDFTTKSGRKTPYFVNTGNFKTGEQLSRLAQLYAETIKEELGGDFDALFGPAYKGIPLASAAAVSLYRDFGIDRPYFFNRKEVKDHGEGGSLVGYKPKEGDRIVIVEDVVTAGTAVRESLEILQPTGAKVVALIVSIDRRERGTGTLSALDELQQQYGIRVLPIATVHDILAWHDDPAVRDAIRDYLYKYGA